MTDLPPPPAEPGPWVPSTAAPQWSPPPPYGFAPPVLVGGLPLASPWERLGARLLDNLIIGAVTLPVLILALIPFFALFFASVGNDGHMSTVSGVSLVLGYFVLLSVYLAAQVAAYYWYEVVYQLKNGQTIGKRTLKIRIVDVATGGPADRDEHRRRYLATHGLQIIMCIPVIGWLVAAVLGFYNTLDSLWLLWDKPFQQCLHDKYAKTAVVKVPA